MHVDNAIANRFRWKSHFSSFSRTKLCIPDEAAQALPTEKRECLGSCQCDRSILYFIRVIYRGEMSRVISRINQVGPIRRRDEATMFPLDWHQSEIDTTTTTSIIERLSLFVDNRTPPRKKRMRRPFLLLIPRDGHNNNNRRIPTRLLFQSSRRKR